MKNKRIKYKQKTNRHFANTAGTNESKSFFFNTKDNIFCLVINSLKLRHGS